MRITAIHGETLLGLGMGHEHGSELEFEVNLKTGEHRGGGYLV